jgi:hypothetical protein
VTDQANERMQQLLDRTAAGTLDRGCEGLRVADSSVMPTITTGNTNALSQVSGAKAARLILAAA